MRKYINKRNRKIKRDKRRFICFKNNRFCTAKIFDKTKKAKPIVGSSYYTVPEVLNKKYNNECDLWNAGVILCLLLTMPLLMGKMLKKFWEK